MPGKNLQVKLRQILSGECQSLGAKALRALLWPAGQIYGAGMVWRAYAYRRHWLPSVPAPAPVISIGNLAAGGTGKTPFAAFLCRRLKSLGFRPAILVRSCGIKNGVIPEEALWLAQHAGGAIIQVDADRRRGALAAIAGGADAIVLDDGFQHLRLRRDVDIVLVDAALPWPGRCPLPGGLLREFPSALCRAHIICLTRCDLVDEGTLANLEAQVRAYAPQTKIFRARHAPRRLMDFRSAEYGLQELAGCRVAALCGIGNPRAFVATLRNLKAEIGAEHFFPDHHAYTPKEIAAVEEMAIAASRLVVCTEKDALKIAPLAAKPAVWRVLGVDMAIADDDNFMESLKTFLRSSPRSA